MSSQVIGSVGDKGEVWDLALTGKRHSAPAAWVRGSVIVLAPEVPLAVTASSTTFTTWQVIDTIDRTGEPASREIDQP